MNDPLTPLESKADEKIIRKRSIPAQIVLWLVVIFLLYAFYRGVSGHFGH